METKISITVEVQGVTLVFSVGEFRAFADSMSDLAYGPGKYDLYEIRQLRDLATVWGSGGGAER